MLEKEAHYFDNKLNELIKTDMGRFVLIKDEQLFGTFEAIVDALKIGYEKFKEQPFFVKQILPAQQPLNFVNNLFCLTSMPSFTQRIPNLEQVGPIIEIVLTPSLPYLQTLNILPSNTKAIKVVAMIDTGATGTVINEELATKLGINPIGSTLINTPSSVNVNCYQYDVQIIFPNNVTLSSIVVTEAPLKGQHIQCLIGRDVLKHCVLVYTGYDNTFTLSF